MPSLLLAIDFGGTKSAVALAPIGAEQWLDTRRQVSPPGADAQSDLDMVLDMARELISFRAGKLLAVGVSFGGPVDFESGKVRLSYHVPGWEGYPLRERLQKEFGVPVSIDNDANAGALGEFHFGAGKNCHSMFYITVSTGIGGGWIINGEIYRGANSLAGEIGHLFVDPGGSECACGKKGCLEAVASGPAIASKAIARLGQEMEAGSILRQACRNNLEMLTAEMVSFAAESGDRIAQEIFQEAAYSLGLAIGQVLTLMNPDRIVLGGGVTKAGKAYWEEIRRSARAHTLPGISVDIAPAKFQDDAPLWGALALAERQAVLDFRAAQAENSDSG